LENDKIYQLEFLLICSELLTSVAEALAQLLRLIGTFSWIVTLDSH